MNVYPTYTVGTIFVVGIGLTFGAIMFDRDATETNPDESAAAIVDILLHGCATRRTRRRK